MLNNRKQLKRKGDKEKHNNEEMQLSLRALFVPLLAFVGEVLALADLEPSDFGEDVHYLTTETFDDFMFFF